MNRLHLTSGYNTLCQGWSSISTKLQIPHKRFEPERDQHADVFTLRTAHSQGLLLLYMLQKLT